MDAIPILPHPSRCFSCSRIIIPVLALGGIKYGDGRIMCTECIKTAVNNQQEAEVILRRVHKKLTGFGFGFHHQEIPVRLVNQNELGRLIDGVPSAQLAGITRYFVFTSAEGTRKGVEKVLILYGLPEEHFASVLAHELGHVWMAIQNFPALPLVVEEGLCEMVDYLWLNSQHTKEAQSRMRAKFKNPNPIYGKGFRLVMEALKGYKVLDLFDYVKRHADLPVGDRGA